MTISRALNYTSRKLYFSDSIMRFIKSCFTFALFSLFVFGVQKFCHKQTDGFAIYKLRTTSPLPNLNSFEENPLVQEILNSPLKYIGRGGQCYAFTTEDNQYVVKILKYNNNYPRIWFRLFPFPFGFESYRQKKIALKQKKLDGEYNSYQIALEHLSEETGIIYFHLHSGLLKGVNLQIEDKIHIHHTLNADSFQFYIQKKGTPLCPTFAKLVQEGKLEEAKTAINEMVSYLFKRSQKQIIDKDNGIWRNFAFYQGHPFQIDIGQFCYDPLFSSHKQHQENLIKFTEDFRNWLNTLSPDLANYFAERLLKD